MKITTILTLLQLTTYFAYSQGILIIDQQSTNLIEGSAGIQSSVPLGQSFRPSLASIVFCSLNVYDGDIFSNIGGTMLVNLRSSSVNGQIISSTTPVYIPHLFFGITNFFFPTQTSLVPGATYVLEPVALSGSDGLASYVTDGSYGGGSLIQSGIPVIGRNLWFQEGVIGIPEPPPSALVALGVGLLGWRGWRWRLVKNRQRRRF